MDSESIEPFHLINRLHNLRDVYLVENARAQKTQRVKLRNVISNVKNNDYGLELNGKTLKFVKLSEYLYINNWTHFKLHGGGWTEEFEGEAKIFAIIIRAFLCNEIPSKGYYRAIGGFSGVRLKETTVNDLELWLKEKLVPYKIGKGRGSHRTNWWHRKTTPKGIVEYLNMTQIGQKLFFDSIDSYPVLYKALKNLTSVGRLTAFDITKDLFEGGIIDLLPDRFYLTGSGEEKGIRALYPEASKKDLIDYGTTLVYTIKERTGMSAEEAIFGVENLLCIYQKNKLYSKYLKGKITVEKFGSILLNG